MLSFLLRRLLYVPLIVLGVMLLTFVLSFVVQTPEQRARGILDKKASPEAIRNYLHDRGYDKPLLINHAPDARAWHDSIFFNEMTNLACLRLGKSDITGEAARPASFSRGAVTFARDHAARGDARAPPRGVAFALPRARALLRTRPRGHHRRAWY